MTKKDESKPRRYDGALAEVADLAAKSKDERDALSGFVDQFEQMDEQLRDAERLAESLPLEIDGLLKCGRLDEKTVEKLAKKRAHLDLCPGRIEALFANFNALKVSEEFTAARNVVLETVNAASKLFDSLHLAEAVADYAAMGVDEDIAAQQARLRHDIEMYHFREREWAETIHKQMGHILRQLVADFDCFAAGLSPASEGSREIRSGLINE
ncbi:MAG: hypothetical protein K9M45_12845 [Kiritimatiellales bacterium]|nr:hypothetical protein [Kiritimatiellales bacterium]